MAITAAEVKELREKTGAGMMDAKKALTETGGDMQAAVDLLRVKGLAKAEKKAGRTAAEGLVALAVTDGAGYVDRPAQPITRRSAKAISASPVTPAAHRPMNHARRLHRRIGRSREGGLLLQIPRRVIRQRRDATLGVDDHRRASQRVIQRACHAVVRVANWGSRAVVQPGRRVGHRRCIGDLLLHPTRAVVPEFHHRAGGVDAVLDAPILVEHSASHLVPRRHARQLRGNRLARGCCA